MTCEAQLPVSETPAGQTSSMLRAALRVLDASLAAAMDGVEAEFTPRGALDSLRGLHISRSDVERSLRDESHVVPAGVFADTMVECLQQDVRFDQLIRAYGLGEFESLALLIALAPEIDLRYQRIYAYLQDDVTKRRPTVDLILSLLCTNDSERFTQRRAFASDATLLSNHLVQLVSDPNYVHPPLLAQYVKPDEQIARYLFGDPGLDSRLRESCRLVKPQATLRDLVMDENTKRELIQYARRTAEGGAYWCGGAGWCLWLHGPDERQQSQAAEALAHESGRALLVFDASRVAASDLEEELRRSLREAALRPAVLYVTESDAWLSDPGVAVRFARLAGERTCTLVVGSPRPAPTAMLGVVRPFALPLPDRQQRAECWTRALEVSGVELKEQTLTALANRFRLTGAQIASAVADACRRSDNRPRDTDLLAAARAQSGDALAAVADKIAPRATWDDIILPPDAIAQLHELCRRVDFQDRVFNDWGFGRKLSRGRGTSALFSGGSGTGKTMAAEVIANSLGLDLYRIDLARVVSKYIGETEKNLERVFEAAEGANAILFFDEADALFGKRSEVRDAHDRYANIETSYLLQRMEEYDGIAILATNLADNLDEAFARRLAFHVFFPFPDEHARLRIWERAWPALASVAPSVDRQVLARDFKLAGGNIRNIALGAAFAAAADGGTIEVVHVFHAIRREHQNAGRASELGQNFGAQHIARAAGQR